MFRKTLTILSLTGLLFSAGLWGVSYRRHFYRSSPYQRHMILINFGRILWDCEDHPRHGISGVMAMRAFDDFEDSPLLPTVRMQSDWWRFTLPLWIPTVLFGAYPLYVLAPLHRRRKRKKLGLCLKCGYDLRASEDRCPECGESFE